MRFWLLCGIAILVMLIWATCDGGGPRVNGPLDGEGNQSGPEHSGAQSM